MANEILDMLIIQKQRLAFGKMLCLLLLIIWTFLSSVCFVNFFFYFVFRSTRMIPRMVIMATTVELLSICFHQAKVKIVMGMR